jgi:hypothetical protein
MVSEYVDDRDSKKQRVKVRSYLPRGHKLTIEAEIIFTQLDHQRMHGV